MKHWILGLALGALSIVTALAGAESSTTDEIAKLS